MVATTLEVLPIFGGNNVSNAAIVRRIYEKFERTGLVVDVNHTSQPHSGRSDKNIAAVRESMAKSPDASIRFRAQKVDIAITTRRCSFLLRWLC